MSSSSHLLFTYDSDGDAIMTDARTGFPVQGKRYRAESADDESRSSKRSRSSSEDTVKDTLECPPAPRKAPRPSEEPEAEHLEHLRGLSTQVAESVLNEKGVGAPAPASWIGAEAMRLNFPLMDELFERGVGAPAPALGRTAAGTLQLDSDGDAAPAPSAPPSEQNSDGDAAPGVVNPEEDAVPPPGGEPLPPQHFLSVTVGDLALPLEFRHPVVLLNFFRFVESYNEIAPQGEEIHVPLIKSRDVRFIRSHPLYLAGFQGQDDLHAFLDKYTCNCMYCSDNDE